MTDTDILKYAVQRELELTKKRSVALARQNWLLVVELEAKLDELALLRKKLTEGSQDAIDRNVREMCERQVRETSNAPKT